MSERLLRTRRKSARRTRGRGQAIVEFGLVALLFALLLMGIVDFAILLNGWLGVSSSARDVARQLAVGVCPSVATTGFSDAGTYCKSSPPGGVPNAPSPSNMQIQGVDWGVGSSAVTINV